MTGPVGAAGIDKTDGAESDEAPEEAPIGDRFNETCFTDSAELPPGSWSKLVEWTGGGESAGSDFNASSGELDSVGRPVG